MKLTRLIQPILRRLCQYLTERLQTPSLRNPPHWRLLVEMRRLGLEWAQFAIGVDAARQQVLQQALLDGLELGDDRLGFADGSVEGVEDARNNYLLPNCGDRKLKPDELGFPKSGQCASTFLVLDESPERRRGKDMKCKPR